jgi:hypothetical protein
VAAAAFVVGGAAIITHVWWLLWTGIAVVVLAIPAGKAIGIMDDTVAWGSPPSSHRRLTPDQQGDPSGDQPAPPRK